MLSFDRDVDSCNNNVSETKYILSKLGFIINVEKCCLIPTTRCQFLGFILDSRQYTIELTERKRTQLSKKVSEFMRLKSCTIREFAYFIGCLVANCRGVVYGWEYCKIFEREKQKAFILNGGDYDARMILPNSIKRFRLVERCTSSSKKSD